MRRSIAILAALSAMIVVGGCDAAQSPKPSDPLIVIPEGFPVPIIPTNNTLTSEKILLGRMLFYDKSLSLDKSVACVDCHKQEQAFTDPRPTSKGVNGELGDRNSPTIVNSAYLTSFFSDGRANSLEEQIHGALFSPMEMYANENIVAERLQQNSEYSALFVKAFGRNSQPNAKLAIDAIASFVRTVVSGNSRYDKFKRGDNNALSQTEKEGMDIFFSEKTQCSSCHKGFNFTDNLFHSTGLYTHYYDKGRFSVTNDYRDDGKFKTPTLRNIGMTAPYMHDGSVETLEKTLEHYNHGGKKFQNKDERIIPLNLSKEEIAALIAFLHSLTDEDILADKRFAQPY